MKSARTWLLLLLLLVVGVGMVWYRTRPEIPVRRTLTNADGRTIDAMIVGKTGATLHLDRRSDGVRFELPESTLGWSDRFFAWRLPEQSPPPPPPPEEEEPGDSYIASRSQRIEDLVRKRAEFVAEIESGSLSGILTRKRREDVIAIDREVAELGAAIEAHRTRSKPRGS